ncbi:cutinase family protein [Actinomycetospora aeridis]|uniref:cutinase family protein n=1 Tax=Actinomycetospora aeridis TaxID=3129231 RepID=UPI0035A0164E
MPPPPASASPQSPCPAFSVQIVRGTNDGQYGSAGEPGAAFEQELLRSGGVNQGDINTSRYPATYRPLNSMVPDIAEGIPVDTRGYMGSVNLGVAGLLEGIRSAVPERCRQSTRIILVGYSQGAHVIRNSFGSLGGYKVTDIVFFGDPCWEATSSRRLDVADNARVRPGGTYNPTQKGLFRNPAAPWMAGVACDPSPPPGSAQLWTYCNSRDIICQGPGAGNWVDTHKEYTDIARQAARRVAESRLNHPGSTAYLDCEPGRLVVRVFTANYGSTFVEAVVDGRPTAIAGLAGPRPDGDYRQIPRGATTARAYGDTGTLDEIDLRGHGCSRGNPERPSRPSPEEPRADTQDERRERTPAQPQEQRQEQERPPEQEQEEEQPVYPGVPDECQPTPEDSAPCVS